MDRADGAVAVYDAGHRRPGHACCRPAPTASSAAPCAAWRATGGSDESASQPPVPADPLGRRRAVAGRSDHRPAHRAGGLRADQRDGLRPAADGRGAARHDRRLLIGRARRGALHRRYRAYAGQPARLCRAARASRSARATRCWSTTRRPRSPSASASSSSGGPRVVRASWLDRLWTRLTARFELTELYEVGFSSWRAP